MSGWDRGVRSPLHGRPPLGTVARALPVGWGWGSSGRAVPKQTQQGPTQLWAACPLYGGQFSGDRPLLWPLSGTSGAECSSPDAGKAMAAAQRGPGGPSKEATGTRPAARPSLAPGQGWAASDLALATVWTLPHLPSLSLWLGCAHGVLSPSCPRESLSQSLKPSLL